MFRNKSRRILLITLAATITLFSGCSYNERSMLSLNMEKPTNLSPTMSRS